MRNKSSHTDLAMIVSVETVATPPDGRDSGRDYKRDYCYGDYLHIWGTKKSLCPRLLQSTVFKMDDTKKNLAQSVGGSTEAAEQAAPRGRRVSQWEGPNEEFLQMLMNLGISKNAAVKVP